MSQERLPISDYITDTKSVLDNSLRVLQVGGGVVDVWKGGNVALNLNQDA
jgi:hypothetical protein